MIVDHVYGSEIKGKGTPGPGICVTYSTCALFYLQCIGRVRLQQKRVLEIGDQADLIRRARVHETGDRLTKRGAGFWFGTIERVQNKQQSVGGGEVGKGQDRT